MLELQRWLSPEEALSWMDERQLPGPPPPPRVVPALPPLVRELAKNG